LSEAVPQIYDDHGIDAKKLDRNALKVVTTLKEAGFDAYLVGGCVRDLLAGTKPKDFDVATNATPEEVKDLFRRSRLIGRRFPIAHVRFGREIIEVSTFRQGALENVETNAQGLIMKDHMFGSIVEDAFRRDFTINALYLDPDTNEIIDYVGGVEDLRNGTLQFIGEPYARLSEDPVRMLRAIRFAAKLNLEMDCALTDLYDETAERLEAIPSARLFDEFLKMFVSGYGAKVWELLKDTPLVRSLFPSCNPSNPLVALAMRNTDARIAAEQPVTPGFLIAVLLWDDFSQRYERDNPRDKPDVSYELAMDTLAIQQQHIAVPRRFSIFAREVWLLQERLESRSAKFVQRTLDHKRFRAAFDFLVLRAESEEKLRPKANWWHDIQEEDGEGQERMIVHLGKGSSKGSNKEKGNSRKRKRSSNSNQDQTSSPSGSSGPSGSNEY
jgi:poly(A) polymerase